MIPAEFSDPETVVADLKLTHEAKIKLLEYWERDALELSVAEEEGMIGGEKNMLGRVRAALMAEGGRLCANRQTTKHGC